MSEKQNMTSTRERNLSTEDIDSTETPTNTEEINKCSECGGNVKYEQESGERVCEGCGLVIEEENIDHGPEWRAFNSQERDQKSRVGAPMTNRKHDKGLSTNIGWKDKDAYGNSLSPKQKEKMSRLRTWNERFKTQDSKERNLKQALGEIERMCSALDLTTQVKETASVLYKRSLEEDLLPGRSIEGVATACVYAAARQCGIPRTLDEIYPVSRVTTTGENNGNEIDRTYRYIKNELGLTMEPVDPADYLNRFISRLTVEDEQTLLKQAEELIDVAKENNIHSGKSPSGIAAASIYLAGLLTNQRTTQREVAEASDTTEVTVRNRYQEILEAYEKIDMP